MTVTGVSQIFDPQVPVSNLTIEDLHNYSVGESGFLIHNTTLCATGIDKLANEVAIGARNLDDALEDLVIAGIDRKSLEEIIQKSGKTPSAGVLAAVEELPSGPASIL